MRVKVGVESPVRSRCDGESVSRLGIVKGVISYFRYIVVRKWELKRKVRFQLWQHRSVRDPGDSQSDQEHGGQEVQEVH